MSEPFDSGDEVQVKNRKTKAQSAIYEENQRIRRAWENADCRRELFQIIDRAGIHASSFVSGKPDLSAFNEGARALGLFAYERVMAVCPDLFALAQKEANQKEDPSE